MFIRVNGIDLYYEKTGEGEPLLLVHGNSESHDIFSVAVPELARTRTVYAIDSRGHGKSGKTDAMGYEEMRDDMIAFIEELGLRNPVFYGFSDGGIIGLMIAMKRPDMLSKLIVSGANLFPKGLRARTRLGIRLVAMSGNELFRMMLREPDIKPEELHAIKTPTVVLAGSHDMVTRRHTRLIADNVPGAVMEIIRGEGHGSYIVKSGKLAPILSRYM